MLKVRNGNILKMGVSEIRVKQIRVNQGLGVLLSVGCMLHCAPKVWSCYPVYIIKLYCAKLTKVG